MVARVAVVASTVLLAAGLSGCGHNKTTPTHNSGGAKVSSSSAAKSGKSAASGGKSSGHKTCNSKATAATIGGKSKCIEAGQECSHKHASDYKQYGFVCEAKGSTYVLRKS